jgi:membrane-associated protein
LAWHVAILGLFVVLVAGGVGFPFPEDLTLLAAGALAQPGLLRLPDVVLTGFAGVVAADWILYAIGRCYGAAFVDHPRLRRLLGVHRIEAVRGALLRHQARAVFFARLVPGTRIVTFLAAGTFGVSSIRFALAEAAGAVIFVPAMVTLGYLFADRAIRIVHGAGRVEHWLVLCGLIGFALYLASRAWATRRPRPQSNLQTPEVVPGPNASLRSPRRLRTALIQPRDCA